MRTTAVVVPVHRNGAMLRELAQRLDAALDGPWTLRLVVDACPEASERQARRLAAQDPRVHVTVLRHNVGQHAALATGLALEPQADVWVCLDGDLQDPPEAVPALVDALDERCAGAVFAGRRGHYESGWRRLTGAGHRRALAVVTGLPADAGAFLAMDARVRRAVVDGVLSHGAPSVVVAAVRSGAPMASIPVVRSTRGSGSSSWSARARVRQSARTLVWAVRHPPAAGSAS